MSLILSGSEGLSDVDGTAATPAIRGTDTNTGMFFPAADTIAFAEGGAEVARFDSSGNLGIGTASPGARLQVEAAAGSGGGDVAIRLRDSTSTNTLQMIRTGATYSYGGMGGNEGALYSANTLTLCADSSGPIKFATNGSEQMRLTSTGLGIGTSSPATKLHVSGQSRVADSSNAANYMTFGVGANAPYGNASISTTTAGLAIVAEGAGNITFRNNGSEAMRIDSSGNLLVGTTSQLINNARLSASGVYNSDSNTTTYSTQRAAAAFRQDGGSSSNNQGSYCSLVLSVNTGLSSNPGVLMRGYGGNGGDTYNIQINQNGNITNTNNSYGSLSDASIKENIVDATPKLNDLMAVQVRSYNLKDDEKKTKQLGVIAQELETVFPAMVETEADGFKSVKYSVFVPMLIKAMQEQQAIIEQLKADVAALKGTA